MSKKALITAFNENFSKLIKTIHLLIPENEQLEVIKNTVHIGARAKPEFYIYHFHHHVTTPFQSQIIAKNQDFFLNLDLKTISNLESENVTEANMFKEKWHTFTKEQQDILWQYVIVLAKLSERWSKLT